MAYRVLIFDDNEIIRQVLSSLFENRGYKVLSFEHPCLFPLWGTDHCPCPKDQHCSDIIISDMKMPYKDGLEFIEELIGKGCGCNNIALMSGFFTQESYSKAKSLGIKIFAKPFHPEDIHSWLDTIEKEMDPGRPLSDLLWES